MTSHAFSPSIALEMFRRGMDTVEIANYVSRSEGETYNALACLITHDHPTRREQRIPPSEYADEVHRNLVRKSADLNEQRRGKQAPVSQTQNSQNGRWRKPVTLPRVSILENSE